jgi:hypothetical protein
MLPIVVGLLAGARERFLRFRAIAAGLHSASMRPNARVEATRQAETLREEIRAIVEQIQEMGVEVKGLDTGLLDFPALRAGQEVCLCWTDGEPRIQFWHDVHEGFAGRQPLAGEDPVDWEWFS